MSATISLTTVSLTPITSATSSSIAPATSSAITPATGSTIASDARIPSRARHFAGFWNKAQSRLLSLVGDEPEQLQVARTHIQAQTTLYLPACRDAYYLHLVESGFCQLAQGDTRLDQTADSVCLFNPDDDLSLSYCAGTDVLLYRVPRALMANAALEFGYIGQQRIRFVSGLAGREREPHLYYLLYAIATESHGLAADAVTGYYSRLLCLAMLRTDIPGQ